MSELFLSFLNRSISAGWLVLAVIVLRLVLKKSPKWVNVLLWGLVAVRLLCPVSLESIFSLIPSAETVSPEIMLDPTPQIQSGIPAVNNSVNPIITELFTPNPAASANPLQILIAVAGQLWLLGMVLMAGYTAVSYLLLRRRVGTAVRLRKNIYQSERISSPFVLGMFRPRIYLPYGMPEQDLAHVIAHEQAHIRRRDHWWKPLGFLLLTLYWFHPLMWAAYILLCRDIELACDEKVIRELGREARADYSEALLKCSVTHRHITACPLAFGEVGVRQRVKNVLNYKKPAFWLVVLAVLLCAIVAVCFLTDPVSAKIVNPWVQEYIPGQEGILGNVDTGKFEAISDDFAIGADKYGRAVFKDPGKAFDTFTELYAEPIALIRQENNLSPISERNYDMYKKFGWQITSGTEALQDQAAFVSRFLDIYENSFDESIPIPNTEPITIEETGTTPYALTAAIPAEEVRAEAAFLTPGPALGYGFTKAERYELGVLLNNLLPESFVPAEAFTPTIKVTLSWGEEDSLVLCSNGQQTTFGEEQQWAIQGGDLNRFLGKISNHQLDDSANTLSLEELPLNYSVEAAIIDNVVVFLDGDLRENQAVWDAFLADVQSGSQATVRLMHRSGASGNSDVYDLTYTGSGYTLDMLVEGALYQERYSYLRHFTGEIQGEDYDAYDYYALTGDPDATWEELFESALSSASGAAIPFRLVYTELIYYPDYPPLPDAVEVRLLLDGQTLCTYTDAQTLQPVLRMMQQAVGLGYEPKTYSLGPELVFTAEDGTEYVLTLTLEYDLFLLDGLFYDFGPGYDDDGSINATPDLLNLLFGATWPEEIRIAYPEYAE